MCGLLFLDVLAAAWRTASVLGPHVEAAREVFELCNVCAVGEVLHQQAQSVCGLLSLGWIGMLLGEQRARSRTLSPHAEAPTQVFIELRNVCAVDEGGPGNALTRCAACCLRQ